MPGIARLKIPVSKFVGTAFGGRKELAMAKLEMTVQERMDLLAYLEAILGCVKSLHVGLGAVMADVAAIRNTVFDAPGELETYKSNLKLAAATAKPMVDQALRSYDDLLDEILDSQGWQN